MPDPITVNNNETAHRFEAVVDGHTAFIDYKQRGDALILIHAEVPAALEGRGVGSALAHRAFEHARSARLKVVPYCSFVAGYLKRHPEYNDLV
jgi:predicted GNAT family acetyltransferase